MRSNTQFCLWILHTLAGLFCRPVFAVHSPGGPETYNEHAGERGGQNLHLTWHAINHGEDCKKSHGNTLSSWTKMRLSQKRCCIWLYDIGAANLN